MAGHSHRRKAPVSAACLSLLGDHSQQDSAGERGHYRHYARLRAVQCDRGSDPRFRGNGGSVRVHYIPRGRTTNEVERAVLVINCVGPESNYSEVDHPLVRNLMGQGLIRPGPANLGIDAQPNGAIIGRDGASSDVLYTLGSTMRGVLWEVIAVPDIRVQAERLAHLLIGGNLG